MCLIKSYHEDLMKNNHIWLLSNYKKNKSSLYNNTIRKILLQYTTEFELNNVAFNEHNKPFIPNSSIHFNLSHSKSYLALGISINNTIGIDIEYRELKNIHEKIAKKYFSGLEQQSDFFKSWTAREAFIKLLGGNLLNILPKIVVKHKKDGFKIGLANQLFYQITFFGDKYDFEGALCQHESHIKPFKIFEIK